MFHLHLLVTSLPVTRAQRRPLTMTVLLSYVIRPPNHHPRRGSGRTPPMMLLLVPDDRRLSDLNREPVIMTVFTAPWM